MLHESVDYTVCYGRSIPSIGEQLFGTRDDMSDEEKTKEAQKVYDSVMNSFPNLRSLMINTQNKARKLGYTETVLGRRRHLPDMQLPEFEFKAMKNYVNPDVDPLDINTLEDRSQIPERIVKDLEKEFSGYKYFGQIARRTRELYEEGIRVINNRVKINDATRQCVNCVSLDTEILTKDGWRTYDQVHEGQSIVAYDLNNHCIVWDTIQHVNVHEGEFDVAVFDTPTFFAKSTMEHRWVVGESDEVPRIKLTSNIYKNKWPDYPILRVADNNFESSCKYSDDQLKLIGWILTDGCYSKPHYGMHIYQSTNRSKNASIYYSMIDCLNRLGMKYNDSCTDGVYHSIYLNKCEFTSKILSSMPDRSLTTEFISSLSQRQAEIVMWSMIEGDGTSGENSSNITFTCSDKYRADMFQYLAFVAGYATNVYEVTPESHNSNPSANKVYSSVTNKLPIQINKSYFTVSVLRIKRAQVYPHHKRVESVYGVWCPTTGTSTWVARCNGKVFITGNSVVQGSAADLTKMAILELEHNNRWKEIGGRLLVPVHDELIAEVPIEYAEEGGKILSKCMCDAADFLPFPSKCDVTTSFRWYGVEYPCPYTKPKSIEDVDSLDPDEIKWIQYYLYDLEYSFPVYKEPDGSKPRGDAALGINGVVSDQLKENINKYLEKRRISKDDFVEDIEYRVTQGVCKKAE